MRTGVLRHSAERLAEAARTATPAGHWLDNSRTAADGLSAWQSGPALKDCADAWQKHIKSVVDQLHTYSRQLHDSAHSYDKADQEHARRLNSALGDLEAPGADAAGPRQ
ncbi:type VII secretion target [Streptomyces sp. NRRL WC-3742]|uniref:type VII secretion target n=1 Tax=Streptomyces sp. NRRL WC-3742 TaxID=1463934 RepID=UPI0004C8D6AC|nr:type VII secretion target [Streptomyces sp. NRRL WC-3742]